MLLSLATLSKFISALEIGDNLVFFKSDNSENGYTRESCDSEECRLPCCDTVQSGNAYFCHRASK